MENQPMPGGFKIRSPQGRNLDLFIGAKSYAQDTMEGWIRGENIAQDLIIPEIVIDGFEIYGLKAWYPASAWPIFFLPARVGVEKPPKLSAEDITVWLGSKPQLIRVLWRSMVCPPVS